MDADHLCHARRHKTEGKPKGRQFIFADIEASQKDEIVQCDWGYAPERQSDCDECGSVRDPMYLLPALSTLSKVTLW